MEKVMQMSNAVQLINLFPMNIRRVGCDTHPKLLVPIS
jgi:hypothetical protein